MKKNEDLKPAVVDQMILQQANERALGVPGKVLPDDYMATEMQDVAGFLKPKTIELSGPEIWNAFEEFYANKPKLDLIAQDGVIIAELFRVRSEKGITKTRDNKKIYQYKVFNFGRILSAVHEDIENHYVLLGPAITIWGPTEEWENWHHRITKEKPTPTFLPEPPKYGGSLLSSLQEAYGVLHNPASDFYLGDIFTFALPLHGGIIKAFQSKEFIYERMKSLYGG